MSYLEKMRARRKNPHAAWHKIRTTIATKKFDLFAVFEGEEDEEFYSEYVYKRAPEASVCPIICDGKGPLLALHDKVRNHYGNLRNVFFFLDTDHDDLIGEKLPTENCFTTDGYSFESYGLSEEVCLKIVEKNFSLHHHDPLLDHIKNIVSQTMNTFRRRARTVMTYVLHLRKMDINVQVDELHFYKFFEFDGVTLRRRGCTIAALNNYSEPPANISFADLTSTARDIRKIDDSKIIRGKMVSQFLIKFLKCLSQSLKNVDKMNGKKCVVRVELGGANYAKQISSCAIESPRLSEFLDELIMHVTSHRTAPMI